MFRAQDTSMINWEGK